MSRTWRVVYNILLIASSAYGLTSKSLRSKKFALVGLTLYCVNGLLGLASEITHDQNIEGADDLVYHIANTAGVDLLVTDVCIASGVSPFLSCLLLVPPALDLLMRYVVNTYWNPLTDVTHILSVALLFNFSIRDSRPILIVAGMSYLFAVMMERNDYYDDVTGYNAIAVFFTAWFLEGKDFKEMGF